MADTPDIIREEGIGADAPSDAASLKTWFQREVLPLEGVLTMYLRQNWRDQSNIEDLLHDVYLQVYEAARKQMPEKPRAFVFATARNLLISRVRQRNIVPIETAADLDALGVAIEAPDQERSTIAREELRRLEVAIDHLPSNYREVVIMRRIDDLSRPEIAVRLGLTEGTVSTYLRRGMCALADMLYAGVSDDLGDQP